MAKTRFFKKSTHPEMYAAHHRSRSFPIGCNVVTLSVLFIIFAVLAIFLGPLYNNWIVFVSAEAQISQLRQDLRKLEGQQISEDVIGQATEWNQTIAEQQRWNQIPVFQWYIPNGWDDIEPLPIPEN